MESSNKKMLYIGLAIVAVIAIAFFFTKSSAPNNAGEQSNTEIQNTGREEVINFELQNYSGDVISRKDFKSEIVVVNAWATWCPFCVNELPEFAALQAEFAEVVTVVAINRAEPTSIAKSFSDKLDLSESIIFLVDQNDTFYKSIGGFSMPETLFLNKKGEILLHKRGPMKIEEMREIVKVNLAN